MPVIRDHRQSGALGQFVQNLLIGQIAMNRRRAPTGRGVIGKQGLDAGLFGEGLQGGHSVAGRNVELVMFDLGVGDARGGQRRHRRQEQGFDAATPPTDRIGHESSPNLSSSAP